MNKQLIKLIVNGDTHEIAVSPNHTLLDVLRNDLGLTGTKRGCTAGSCGVCTVNAERGEAICSCLTLAIEWDGRSVTTIEGIEIDDRVANQLARRVKSDVPAATHLDQTLNPFNRRRLATQRRSPRES